jgi:hypothetical protein
LVVDLVGGNAVREHARGIEFDADFAIDAAHALHLRNPRHGQQFALQIVVDEPGNILGRHALAFDRVIADRLGRSLDARDDRFGDVGGQFGAYAVDCVARVIDGAAKIAAAVHLDLSLRNTG